MRVLAAWAQMHASLGSLRAGVAHGAFDNELDALAGMRELLSYLPLSNRDALPRVSMCDTNQWACPPNVNRCRLGPPGKLPHKRAAGA